VTLQATRRIRRLNFSVALSECAQWVLNCEHARFVFVEPAFAKSR